jgi:hypothetical protein
MSTFEKGDWVIYDDGNGQWSAIVTNPNTQYNTIEIKFDGKILPKFAKNINLPGPQGQSEMYINNPKALTKIHCPSPTSGGRRKLRRSTKRRRRSRSSRSSRR